MILNWNNISHMTFFFCMRDIKYTEMTPLNDNILIININHIFTNNACLTLSCQGVFIGCSIELFGLISSRHIASLLIYIKLSSFHFCLINVAHIDSHHQLSLKMNDLWALSLQNFCQYKLSEVYHYKLYFLNWLISNRSNCAACLPNRLNKCLIHKTV